MIKVPPTEMVEMGALQRADYNPRKITPKMLADLQTSMQEFGFIQPIVARREDGLILGGHQRYDGVRALLEEKEEDWDTYKVPVVYVDELSDARAKVLNVALNKISGDWDYEKLGELILSIQDAPELEDAQDVKALLSMTGFTDKEVQDILALTIETGADELNGPGDVDPDAALLADKLKFSFKVDSIEDANLCMQVLEECGMTGKSNAGAAFVLAMRRASRAAS